ncbi:MAG: hypothetical protein IPP90_05815 [Gemmatimonadaceae bacterium]|nr:hypothetical protein [Gemmatimonadaceae bacterium]
MRNSRVFRRASCVLLLGIAAQLPARAQAQRRSAAPPRGIFSGAGYLQVSEPKGDFGTNTGNGFGLNAAGIWRLAPSGLANIRADAGFITYGSNTRRIDFANTGGLVKLDLRTNSSIFSLVGGPQIGGTAGPISPYIAALGGFSVFWTESSVEGSRNNSNEPFASTTNASDFVVAYGGAAGLTIRLHEGDRPVRLDLGARLLRHDDVSYLNEARVEEAFKNNRDPIPLRGRADFVTYYLGANVVVF